MLKADKDKQYYLYIDVSKIGLKGILFQLVNTLARIEAIRTIKDQIRIILFMSYKLADIKSRYTIIKREVLVIVRCLIEVRWIIVGSPYSTKIYINYNALLSILVKGLNSYKKVA